MVLRRRRRDISTMDITDVMHLPKGSPNASEKGNGIEIETGGRRGIEKGNGSESVIDDVQPRRKHATRSVDATTSVPENANARDEIGIGKGNATESGSATRSGSENASGSVTVIAIHEEIGNGNANDAIRRDVIITDAACPRSVPKPDTE